MSKLSLKYRIALIIFVLEAVMMAIVLGTTLSYYFDANNKLSRENDIALLDIVSDQARVVLLTDEFDEFQPYVEQIIRVPAVEHVLLLNTQNRVVVSSKVTEVGQLAPTRIFEEGKFWRKQDISNGSGKLGTLAIQFSHEAIVVANRKAIDLGIYTALAGMVTIAIVGIFIGFLLTRRLNLLNKAAQRIAKGDLSVKTNLKGNDEISILSQAFDLMAGNIKKVIANLKESESDLRRAHDGLENRILERTAELAVARDNALEASRTKSAFVANMSHELRTPLNAIIGYSQLITEDIRASHYDSIELDLNKIRNAGSHLLDLINNILDLSKIEMGEMYFDLIEFTITDLLDDVIGTIAPLIQRNGNKFEIDYKDDIGSMSADLVKVRQILINILGNAAKFTKDGCIKLAVEKLNKHNTNWIIFAIKDTGIGITSEQITNLFNEFSQADVSTTRKYGGTGLGLAISYRFCTMMGGNIKINSTVGEGATFTITLPTTVVLKEANDPQFSRDTSIDQNDDLQVPKAS